MMMFFFALFLGCSSGGQAEFDAGVSASRSGDQVTAVRSFVDALDSGGQDASVYHGLGNALYREGRGAEAVAAWRRGLALDPTNGDIAANLDQVRKTFKDRLDPPAAHRGAFFWQSALSPLETAFAGSIGLSLGCWLMVLGRVRRLRHGRGLGSNERWFGFVSAALGIILAVSTVDVLQQRAGAVVIANEVDVRSALGPAGVSLFVLHEGAEVTVADSTDTHQLVVLSDGRKGWINTDTLLSTDPASPFVVVHGP
ncbi:MAG: hypothetical protein CL930_11410 [Deltaproteobacteria bacterium]|nr:hypothetical protein [Deltaproteobacteria bacterium]